MICRSCLAVVSYAVVLERPDPTSGYAFLTYGAYARNGVYCGPCAGQLKCVDEDIESSREYRRLVATSPPILRLGAGARS
jgi:hypothetical protein